VASTIELLILAQLSARPPVTAATDTSTLTNATTSYNAMSNIWPVAAYDARAGTVYRLTVTGSGTQGSTPQAIGHQLSCFGATAVANRVMATTTVGANLAFSWRYVAEITVTAPGAAGTARVSTLFNWTQGVGGSGLTSSNEATAATDTSATVDTIANGNITAQLAWASITGTTAPTLTSFRSALERLGP
jgi:hypothetical protein